MITQSELKEILHYDKDTGVFTWLVANSRRVEIGDVAGCVVKKQCGKSYIKIRINGKLSSAHRLAVLYVLGRFPYIEVDHLDGCGTNNKWINLREVSMAENQKNRRLHSNNSSGVCGVFWDKGMLKWKALIKSNNKSIYIGRYKNLSDAINARKSAEIEHGFHKNHGQTRPL